MGLLDFYLGALHRIKCRLAVCDVQGSATFPCVVTVHVSKAMNSNIIAVVSSRLVTFFFRNTPNPQFSETCGLSSDYSIGL